MSSHPFADNGRINDGLLQLHNDALMFGMEKKSVDWLAPNL
jgi:hypothetical protein